MHLRLIVPLTVARPTGGNVYDLALADALRAQGDQVDVVASTRGHLARRAVGPGLVLIDGLLASNRPDVVHACRAGVLVHMPLAWRDPSLAGVEAQALRAARAVIATSRWTAEFLRETYGVEAIVVSPGVDPAPVETGSDPPLIVHVAALAPHKDQLSVVRALAAVSELPWHARLVGSHEAEPAYAAQVIALVEESGLTDRVELPGELSRDDAFRGADLSLLPSRVEAYGMVITEALARGVPAVVSAGGPEEALGQTVAGEIPGIVLHSSAEPSSLVEPVETTLAKALRHWLSDPELRAELRRRALIRRRELAGWDAAATQLSAGLLLTP